MLIFFVVDATLQCIRMIRELSRYDSNWPSKSLARLTGSGRAVGKNHLGEWLDMRLIGCRSEAVSRLIYYPVIVILLMLASRSSYFDNWGLPAAIAIVIGLNLAVAFGCGFYLRVEAERSRRRLLARLSGNLLVKEGEEARKVRDTIGRIESYDRGAFGPFMRQPALQAILYPSGGIGAITLLQYIMAG